MLTVKRQPYAVYDPYWREARWHEAPTNAPTDGWLGCDTANLSPQLSAWWDGSTLPHLRCVFLCTNTLHTERAAHRRTGRYQARARGGRRGMRRQSCAAARGSGATPKAAWTHLKFKAHHQVGCGIGSLCRTVVLCARYRAVTRRFLLMLALRWCQESGCRQAGRQERQQQSVQTHPHRRCFGA